MFNNLNKWEKAGLIIGSIECVAGFTIAMYAHIKCKKERDQAIPKTWSPNIREVRYYEYPPLSSLRSAKLKREGISSFKTLK